MTQMIHVINYVRKYSFFAPSYCACNRDHGGFDCSNELVTHKGNYISSDKTDLGLFLPLICGDIFLWITLCNIVLFFIFPRLRLIIDIDTINIVMCA